MSLTREEAINMNLDKTNQRVISYITGVGPLYERNVTFLTKKSKTRNTQTFIMTNRTNILDAYLVEKEREEEEIRRRENAITWAELIEQEEARALRRRLEKEKEKEKYKDDLIFKIDEPTAKEKHNHYKKALKAWMKIGLF
jgi:hypothetical protein